MKVAVIGSMGYVGGAMLRACMVSDDVEVIGIDKKNPDVLKLYKQLNGVHIVFVCVPTPFKPTEQTFDYYNICQVLWELKHANYDGIVCLRSTIAPDFFKLKTARGIDIYHPEFLTAAKADSDFASPDVLVMGVNDLDNGAISALKEFYTLLGIVARKRIECNTMEDASYLKLIHNTYRALRISFLNEIAVAVMRECGNWDEGDNGLNNKIAAMFGARDFGGSYLSVPGPDGKFGFGGACFPKDLAAFIGFLEKRGHPHEILSAVRSVNSKMRLAT